MGDLLIRPATAADVPAIVALLADDDIGTGREDVDDLAPYLAAFAEVDADPRQLLVVGELDGQVVATMQLTVLPGLSRRGSSRGQIEAVRVAGERRGQGLGGQLIRWGIEECRRRGLATVQLTSDARRVDARRFYERLGFTASHIGFKLPL